MIEGERLQDYGVIIDGMRGLTQALRPCPVQLCQFHQMLTVLHYLTQEPDLDASRDLLSLVNNITRMDKESFAVRLANGMNGTRRLSMSVSMTNASERRHCHIYVAKTT